MLEKFIEYVNKESLNVDSVAITQADKYEEHIFTENKPQNIRSISKMAAALGVGKAIEKGLITLDTKIILFFNDVEIYNKDNIPYLEKLTVRHLLTLTMGQDKSLMNTKHRKELSEETDFIREVLNYPISSEPGTSFIYTNAATYLLCAIIQKLTDEYFGDWVYEHILKHLDMEKPFWQGTQQGICLGASELYLTNSQVHKLGLLLLSEGTYQGKEIISQKWINFMHQPHTVVEDIPKWAAGKNRRINRFAYGYHIWVCGDGTPAHPKTYYFADGTDGQYLIIDPENKRVISILSHQKDTAPIHEGIKLLI